MTRRRRVALAVLYRPFWSRTWHRRGDGVSFPPLTLRKKLLRWMANPEQLPYEFGPEPEPVPPEQPRLWDTGYMAWESTHDPAEGL